MVTFLHTADWQIGMTRRWLHGEAQARYAVARTDAVRRLGALAAERSCEFVVVCGDVFETNQVSAQTVRRALDALREVPVPVYLLPGNHDPLDQASVYDSPVFTGECPDHVHVLRQAGLHEVRPGVELLAAPWTSKHPDTDLVSQALSLAGPADGTVRVVVGHGAVDVLDPDRANRAAVGTLMLEEALAEGRIHYAALGDRHSCTQVGTGGAVWYAGTPEVTDFREERPGQVLVVRAAHGRPPTVSPHRIGTWDFRVLRREVNGMADVRALDADLDALPGKERTVVRLVLRGALGLAEHAELTRVTERHADLLASLHAWDRHTALTVLPEGDELADLGLGGFVAAAAEEIAEESADALPEADLPDLDDGRLGPPAGGPPAWPTEVTGGEDPESARDALALLYRLAGEAVAR